MRVDRRRRCAVVDHDHNQGQPAWVWIVELFTVAARIRGLREPARILAGLTSPSVRPQRRHRHHHRLARLRARQSPFPAGPGPRSRSRQVARARGPPSRDVAVVDHDHRRGKWRGSWVSELYGCGEYRCGANRPDPSPARRSLSTRRPRRHHHHRLGRHDGSDEPSPAPVRAGPGPRSTCHGGWHVRVDRRPQCAVVDHDHRPGHGSWVGPSVAANTGAARTGTMTIAGQIFTVRARRPRRHHHHRLATTRIAPTSQSIAAAGGAGTAISQSRQVGGGSSLEPSSAIARGRGSRSPPGQVAWVLGR